MIILIKIRFINIIILSEKNNKGEIIILDDLKLNSHKTKELVAILKNFKCSGISEYTVNYPVANTNKSVKSNFFIEGNKVMKKMLNINDDELFPWSKQ